MLVVHNNNNIYIHEDAPSSINCTSALRTWSIGYVKTATDDTGVCLFDSLMKPGDGSSPWLCFQCQWSSPDTGAARVCRHTCV